MCHRSRSLFAVLVTLLGLGFGRVQSIAASAGYHYAAPTAPTASSYTGHQFAPLSTIVPLPAVPALPPLPTPRSGGSDQLQQLHASLPAVAATYVPPTRSASIANAYQRAPFASAPAAGVSSFGGSRSVGSSTGYGYSQPQAQTQPQPIGLGVIVPSMPAPSPSLPPFDFGLAPRPTAASQPLRIPFGKQAIIHFPTAANAPPLANSFDPDSYYVNGRQLKQYAVIEIIDNDIAHDDPPFLGKPFFDSFRPQIGASSGLGADAFAGTGADGGLQLRSRANTLLLEQQSLAALRPAPGDAVALGSGGLGYIRLANGNVYLGSGSLGYVSGQQRTQSIRDARTRTGASMPDALHFGHGALGGPENYLRFK